jgi:hypothetical protein
MNLQELQESKKTTIVKKALREHYEMDINFDKLSSTQVTSLLAKVKKLISETRTSGDKYNSHTNSSYLKLVMMEQALSDRLTELTSNTKIIIENEEVQKSQVILAVKDMVDSVQKMIEQISKMNVEELPAVVDGIQNEFGTNEGQQFDQTAGNTLRTLQDALANAKNELNGALGAITGGAEGGFEEPTDVPGMDAGGSDLPDMDSDVGDLGAPDMDEPEEPEEPEDLSGAGRERR